jgi:hypothetical protein
MSQGLPLHLQSMPWTGQACRIRHLVLQGEALGKLEIKLYGHPLQYSAEGVTTMTDDAIDLQAVERTELW